MKTWTIEEECVQILNYRFLKIITTIEEECVQIFLLSDETKKQEQHELDDPQLFVQRKETLYIF